MVYTVGSKCPRPQEDTFLFGTRFQFNTNVIICDKNELTQNLIIYVRSNQHVTWTHAPMKGIRLKANLHMLNIRNVLEFKQWPFLFFHLKNFKILKLSVYFQSHVNFFCFLFCPGFSAWSQTFGPRCISSVEFSNPLQT